MNAGIQERITAPRGVGARQRTLHRTSYNRAEKPAAAHGGDASVGLAFGGLTKEGLIQERMRWPGRTGTEVMRTVASRVVTHTPSHYAMLGVPRDFTDAQLRKQYRLLALRFHPDAAARNGIDERERHEEEYG